MTTPTIEAIEEEFDREFTVDNGPTTERSIKDPNGMAGPIKAFIRTAFLAGRQSMAEEIEGEIPAESSEDRKQDCEIDNCTSCKFARGKNSFRAQVLEIIAKKKGT